MSTQEQAAVTQSADSKDGHGTATAKSSLIMDPAVTSTSPSDEQQLHKLTAAEFQEYNRLARHMDAFHNHFRHSWNELYATASGSANEDTRLSPTQFLHAGLQFIEALTMHHNIEETYVFPRLASRMPAFQKNLTLISQHKQIHAGMDKLQAYLQDCRRGVQDLRMQEVKELMDSWRDVLWAHLDKEVEELGAEKMRRYWSLKEMRAFGF